MNRYHGRGLIFPITSKGFNVSWTIVYLKHRVITTEHPIDDPLLDHLSLLGWEHINLTGDY